MRGSDLAPRIDAPVVVIEVEHRIVAEKVHVSLPEALHGPDVLPVAGELVGEHSLSAREHCRDDVLSEVLRGFRVLLVRLEVFGEDAAVEYVDAHRRFGALRLLRLLLELDYPAVLVGVHDAESRRLLERDVYHRDCRRRAHLLVVLEHSRIIHLIDMVARENQHIIRVVAVDEVHVLVNGVRRALVPVRRLRALIRRENHDAAVHAVKIPRLTVSYVFVEHKRLILCQHADRVYPGIDTVREGEIYYPVLGAERDRRLRRLLGQCIEPASLPSGKEHCHAFFLVVHTDGTS